MGKVVGNVLPIRLLRLSDMEPLSREDIYAIMSKAIEDGEYLCEEEEEKCNCSQKLMKKLRYSILSHRWESEELVFDHLMMLKDGSKDVNFSETPEVKSLTRAIEKLIESSTPLDGTLLDKIKKLPSKPAIEKLLSFRRVSMERECEYGWVDTVCINKAITVELDESIRSMYAWYRDSYVCIVHLGETDHSIQMDSDPWFTRGWTLQELLAPKRIAFYARGWFQITSSDNDKLEDKKQLEINKENEDEEEEEKSNEPKSLWPIISKITEIPLEDLLDFKPGPFEIGRRLQWASKRQTKKPEDLAYCLLGIFDVNLPISYGEHERAFYRLQAELIRRCNDKSVFAWEGEASKWNSMLAAGSQCFSDVLPPLIDVPSLVDSTPLLSMTNIGLCMPALVYKIGADGVPRVPSIPEATYMAIIAQVSGSKDYFIVLLAKTEIRRQYRRVGMIQSPIVESRVLKHAVELVYIK
jgi:hypothetical protein